MSRYEWRDGNQLELLINGEEFYPRVFDCIRAAQQEVLLETFIIFEDKVGTALRDVLVEAAGRGVRVEVTVDGYGTADVSAEFVASLTSAGVKVHMFDPRPRVMGFRTNLFRRLHRKVVVVDGEVAFIGGLNYSVDHLAEHGPMAKQDYALQVRGPIVEDIHRDAFALLQYADRQPSQVRPLTRHAGSSRLRLVVRDNDTSTNDIEAEYLRIIRSANQRLLIANAYFFPGYRLLRELRNAARRGVKVNLILQGQPDMPWARGFSRLLYNYLLKDGVVIHEYCQRPLHGKVALADHEWATVGSSNLDPLSLALNLEANLMVRDPAFNQKLHDHLLHLATDHCKPMSLERITRGHWWRAPIIFLCFHFMRHFPAIAGWFPAHSPRLKSLKPVADQGATELAYEQEKAS